MLAAAAGLYADLKHSERLSKIVTSRRPNNQVLMYLMQCQGLDAEMWAFLPSQVWDAEEMDHIRHSPSLEAKLMSDYTVSDLYAADARKSNYLIHQTPKGIIVRLHLPSCSCPATIRHHALGQSLLCHALKPRIVFSDAVISYHLASRHGLATQLHSFAQATTQFN